MGQPVDSVTSGVHDAASTPAASKVSQNMMVTTAMGAIGVITDVPQFSGATVSGLWTVGATRVRINGLPIIHRGAIGVGISASGTPPSTGPLQLGQSDSGVSAL